MSSYRPQAHLPNLDGMNYACVDTETENHNEFAGFTEQTAENSYEEPQLLDATVNDVPMVVNPMLVRSIPQVLGVESAPDSTTMPNTRRQQPPYRQLYIGMAIVAMLGIAGVAIGLNAGRGDSDSAASTTDNVASVSNNNPGTTSRPQSDPELLALMQAMNATVAQQAASIQILNALIVEQAANMRGLNVTNIAQAANLQLLNNAIADLRTTLSRQNTTMTDMNRTILSLTATVVRQNATIEQAATLQVLNTTIANIQMSFSQQNTTMANMNHSILSLAAAVASYDTEIEVTFDELNATVVEQARTLASQQTWLSNVSLVVDSVVLEMGAMSSVLLSIRPFGRTLEESVSIESSIGDKFVVESGGLNGVEVITGDFMIRYSPLRDISGLNMLTSVGEDLQIQFNAALTNISGLNMLTRVLDNLSIINNDALTNISGLNMLTRVEGSIQFENNPLLTMAAVEQGLASLQCRGSAISCYGCPASIRNLPTCTYYLRLHYDTRRHLSTHLLIKSIYCTIV